MMTQPVSLTQLGTVHEFLYEPVPLWNVVMWNDPVSLTEYVIYSVMRIFGYTQEYAESLVQTTDLNGKVILWTGNFEKAQYFMQQMQLCQIQVTLMKVDEN